MFIGIRRQAPDVLYYGSRMKKKNICILAALALCAVVAGGVAYCLLSETPAPKKVETGGRKKKVKNNKKKPKKGVLATRAERINETGKTRPNILADLERDEEAKLTAAERALLEELQNGVDANSLRRVAKTAEKIQKLIREKGEKNVPVLLRSEAVEALGWFLPDSLADLLPFMADSDSDVLDDALTQFESALDDSEIGDRNLSDIVKSFAKVIDNEDALDALFMCVENDMRNSIAVETYREILKTGSPAAKSRVWESVEDFTGEDEVTTEAALEDWLKENPDDDDDEEFYGPSTDDDDGSDD